MNFKFGNTPATSTQGASSQLAPYKIHTVKFDGLTAETIEKKDGSQSFSVMKIKFSNADGNFEHAIFEPNAGDDVRQDNNYGYQNPSRVEELMFTLRHLLAAVAPATNKQIEDKGGIDVPNWEGLRQFMVKATTKSIGQETQIKLMGDKDGRPRFPGYVLGISKKDEVYPKTNFIGAKLTFTANELKQIEAKGNAKPSAMPESGTTDLDLSDDLDLDLELV